MEPTSVPIEYNEYGKPQISGDATLKMEFNLSHAGPWAVFAFAVDRPVGVDVECWLPDGEWEPMLVSCH